MAEIFFDLLNQVLHLMSENKLRKDIDDTLLEKLLTFLEKCKIQPSLMNDGIIAESHKKINFDFIEELVKQTSVLQFINEVNESVAKRDENYFVRIKTFALRLLGFILESPIELFPLENLIYIPIFRDNIPSIQDALLACLSSITKQLKGTLWFMDNRLDQFVFSSFYSSSYYVRKSAAKFFVNFIMQWTSLGTPEFESKKMEAEKLQLFIKISMSEILKHLFSYQHPKEMQFSECCIFVTKQLLELENFENVIGRKSASLADDIAGCFITDLPEDNEFCDKLIDLFLAVHHKSKLPDEVITDVIKCLIIREDITVSFKLASSFANIGWPKSYSSREITFFILPIYMLTNVPITGYSSFFQVDFNLIQDKIRIKMENKSDCKLLFSSSLSALIKLVRLLDSDQRRDLALEILKVVKCCDLPHHKWHCSVLEDRNIHHSFLDLLLSFISTDVHSSFLYQESDLVFQIIIGFLKKPSSDSNFLSQLLLLLKNLLVSHEKLGFNLNDTDKDILIHVLCRMLLDNREAIVDSAIQLAGQILSGQTYPSYRKKLSKQSVHSIIWDISIHGCHDGSVRSTALKVIMGGCLEEWCLNEIKSLKEVTEIDIVKILFDLTYNPDFFLQREALLCLFNWMKSKWTDLPLSSQDYLFSALVCAVKSLDLELKLISLNAWLWLIDNKFIYCEVSEIEDYIEHLSNCGFGLSLSLALEDYDEAVKYKAAKILFNLKSKLITFGFSNDSITVTSCEEPRKCNVTVELNEPLSEKKRDEGIDNVMEISTAEQITNICRPPRLSDMYDFKQEYYSTDSKDRKCSASLLWTHLWSEKLISIVHPRKLDIKSEIESLLKDIIAAKVSDIESMEDTPDCY